MPQIVMDGDLARDRFQIIVEANPTATLTVDELGRILFINSQVESLFGYSREELLGQPVEILVPTRFRDMHPQQRAEFFRKPSPRAMGAGRDLFAVRKDGTEFPVEIGLYPIQTDTGLVVLGTIADVTQRKRMEERIRLVVEAAPNAMVMVDQEGKIVFVNSQTETMFGYDRKELVGQLVEVLVPARFRSKHPGHRNGFFANPASRAMGTGRDLYAVRKDGTEFPVEIGLNPVETDEGVLVLSAIVDITERKRAEQALHQSKANLRQALAQLELQARDLQEANESLSQYAYVVSHDIRAPLRAIRNYADFLAEDLGDGLEEEQKEYIAGLAEAVDQAEQLVDDLLLLSRVDRSDVEPEVLETGDFLKNLIQSLVLSPEAEVTLEAECPALSIDATLFRQIFQNLILNAVKFNQSAQKRVSIGCSLDEANRYEFHVRDNGIGIDARHQEQIFRVFQRLHDSEEYEGTGIGLAIVKKAVNKLGGTIRIESNVGDGSTFFVRLPSNSSGSGK